MGIKESWWEASYSFLLENQIEMDYARSYGKVKGTSSRQEEDKGLSLDIKASKEKLVSRV